MKLVIVLNYVDKHYNTEEQKHANPLAPCVLCKHTTQARERRVIRGRSVKRTSYYCECPERETKIFLDHDWIFKYPDSPQVEANSIGCPYFKYKRGALRKII